MAERKKIPLIRPHISERVKKRVLRVLESGFLTEGEVTKQFEEKVRDYVGATYAIAVNSCTTGLELALRALRIGPGDEVIVPDFTYPATASVVSIVGATPVLVDISRETMLINYDRLEEAITGRTKAVIPVSLFGNPLDYDRLNNIKKRYELYIIEDAACALGASYKNKMVGTLADITVFSFHPRKFITTGEGGMITTDNKKWAQWIRSYKHFGIGDYKAPRAETMFEIIGTNYKMSDVQAAIGLEQMKIIDTMLARRRKLAERYFSLLSDLDGVAMPRTTDKGMHSYQSFCVYVKSRDTVMKRMRKAGIEVQIGTYALHTQPAFAQFADTSKHGPFTGSTFSFSSCLTLPLYHQLKKEDQLRVVKTLEKSLTAL